jgi:CheY-like chemotaxis protein
VSRLTATDQVLCVAVLVERHGGTIRVESAGPGHGATFTVELPRAMETASRPDVPADALVRHALAGLDVLVVDDEPDGRDAVAAILASAGARVRTASSAKQAWALLASQPFDVLVSDIGMPDEDGYSLVRRMSESSRRPRHAVALSAYASRADVARALDAGFSAHVAKPVDAAELIGRIVHLLRPSGGSD